MGIDLICQPPNSLQFNFLDVGMWMGILSRVDKLHRSLREDPEVLYKTVCKAWDDYGERKGESLKRVWGCLVDSAKTCIIDKGGNRSYEARKGYAVAIDPDEGLLAEPAEVGAVAHVEVEAVSDDEEGEEEEGRV